MRVTVGLLIVGVLSCLVLLVDGIARSAAGESAAAAIALAALLVAVANDIRRFRGARTGRGLRVVAIGGGTGLPVSLRAAKIHTSNITAIVTVADDGGSSGRLRREMRVAPPGDLRNNIAALADDESLMTRLLQYRFSGGELRGHAFGNLFIAALADITGSLDQALTEVARVLNLRGRVLPTT
ncbi:MAG: gluconeogenesis factor YvcK family protein, partial [Phototrophicaceae bacterium]